MEITIDNFDIMQDKIIDDIKNADFISLDLELTGLNPKGNSILDTTEIRYNKYKQIAEKYRIIQVGITTFLRNEQTNEFISKPYNFYVFPEDNTGNLHLNCELSAILFNREHKMDFNKWIYKGIPYVNAKTEKQMLDNLSDANINLYDPSNPSKAKVVNLFRDADRQKYEDFCKQFSEFLYSEAETHIFEKYPKFMQYHIINNLQESIRKRVYFSNEKINGKEYFIVTKCDENAKKLKIQGDLSEKINQVKKAKGFRNIFEAIVRNKKILVGHNCIVDINFVISHFGDQLPSSYADWKKMVQGYFQKVYDTKFLFETFANYMENNSADKENNINLEKIYTRLHQFFKDTIKIRIADGFPNLFEENAKFHDAAYDSFVTGAAFIYMTQSQLFKPEELMLHSNKMFMMKTLYKGFYLDAVEEYCFKDAVVYGLKAHKNQSDIEISKVFPENLANKIVKHYNIESTNACVIMVQIDSEETKNEVEKAMNNFNNIFNYHSIDKLREILQEDSEKKYEERRNKNKQNPNANANVIEVNQNTENANKQTNENLINI